METKLVERYTKESQERNDQKCLWNRHVCTNGDGRVFDFKGIEV
jgi:hypothetical protein